MTSNLKQGDIIQALTNLQDMIDAEKNDKQGLEDRFNQTYEDDYLMEVTHNETMSPSVKQCLIRENKNEQK